MSELIELASRLEFMAEVSDMGREPDHSSVTRRSARAMRAAAKDAAQLRRYREALEAIRDGDYTMPSSVKWREDGEWSKHDRCPHGRWMYDGCDDCCSDFASQALQDPTP